MIVEEIVFALEITAAVTRRVKTGFVQQKNRHIFPKLWILFPEKVTLNSILAQFKS